MPPPDGNLSQGFLEAAETLLGAGERRPRQALLRRSVSSSYYAVFHALARMTADCLVGAKPAKRSNKAWTEVYRGLQHGRCKEACKEAERVDFPPGLKKFSRALIQLQDARERADYDPYTRFAKDDARSLLETARIAVAGLKAVPMLDRRAFAAWVLITSPGAKEARRVAHRR